MAVLAIPGVLLGSYLLLLLAMSGLGFKALRVVKRQGDEVRKGFTWYHITFWLFYLATLFSVVTYAIVISTYYGDNYQAEEALIRLASISDLFYFLSNAALLVCTSELAAGLKLAVKQQGSKGFRIYIVVLASLIALFIAGYYVYQQYRFTVMINGPSHLASVLWAVGFSALIAIAALLLGTLSVAIFALKQRSAAKKHAGGLYSKAAGLVALAACLNLALFLWDIMVALVTGLAAYVDSRGLSAADAVISHWGTFGILVVIYLLGKKKADGLWSTPAKTVNAPEVGGAYLHPQAYGHSASHV